MTSYNPVDWWHGLQGGPLAESRPPPPSADAPYPNLGSVPPKPAAADAAAQARISSGLVADRANAQYSAGLSPLQAFPPATVLPPPRPTGGDDQPNATLAAASATPPAPPARGPLGPPQAPLPEVTPSAPRKAPVAAVSAAPLSAPAVPSDTAAVPVPATAQPAPAPAAPSAVQAAPGAGATPVQTASVSPRAAGVAAAPRQAAPPPSAAATPDVPGATPSLPGMPDQPPSLAQLSGVALPQTIAPMPPPATPAPPAPAPSPAAPGGPVAIAFQPGSATLPAAALAPLKLLAQRHGAAPIAVTGYGDATSSDAAAQSSALPLALARARSIAANLLAAGVPSNAIRVGAEAQGAGGAARVVD